jgi:signal transduction histidine kinase
MRLSLRRLSVRFAALLAAAAVLPLVAYGVASLFSLQRGTRESIVAGNMNVATRAAEEIRRYIVTNAEILKALAADLQNTGLEQWQQDRVLKNYVLQFREFRELTLFDQHGSPVATSRVGHPRVTVPDGSGATEFDGVSMSRMHMDAEGLPTAIFAVRLLHLDQPAGWLVGEFNLEEMWRMVDQIRLGQHGYAMVVTRDGRLVAHGDPDKKALVAQERDMGGNPLIRAALAQTAGAPVSSEYVDAGRRALGVAARVAPLGWVVAVEQPTREAYANATELQRQLVIAISLALLVMISVGFLFGRSFIRPILDLQQATHSLAAGQLDTRVHIDSTDEFAALGADFNTMADRLAELQENVKRQERQAMFGRIAAGLVHDLSHPIQNIGNSTRLLLRDDVDADSRDMFRRTIERELATLKRFMDDLRNLVKPKPIERFPLDVSTLLAEIVDTMRPEGERHGVTLEAQYAEGALVLEGDRFALGRVYRNLIANAVQATAAGGSVTVRTARAGDQVEIVISDTGSGIPPDRLATIFEDFVTTKRRGLGLGLAISKRIVEQLEGTITVASEVGRGTTFTLRFPARHDRAVQVAAS